MVTNFTNQSHTCTTYIKWPPQCIIASYSTAQISCDISIFSGMLRYQLRCISEHAQIYLLILVHSEQCKFQNTSILGNLYTQISCDISHNLYQVKMMDYRAIKIRLVKKSAWGSPPGKWHAPIWSACWSNQWLINVYLETCIHWCKISRTLYSETSRR